MDNLAESLDAVTIAKHQRKRRNLYLQKQKEAQEKCLDQIRELCIEVTPPLEGAQRGYLMFGEWLLDVPEDFAEKWKMAPYPEGKRCLVVAEKGMTKAFAKSGRQISAFESALPGGSHFMRGSLTMLDCVFIRGGCDKEVGQQQHHRFYVLDMLCWNKFMYVAANYEVRQFVLQARSEMAGMMSTQFPFRLDGLLFYHCEGSYIPNESPLVGWLKPWMMSELRVDIPEKYAKQMSNAESLARSSRPSCRMAMRSMSSSQEFEGIESIDM